MQIVLITVPGFLINYILILWHLAYLDKLNLKNVPWLLFSVILVSSDPMQTAAAIRDLGRYIFFFLYLKYYILYLTFLFLRSFVHCSFSQCEVGYWGTGTELGHWHWKFGWWCFEQNEMPVMGLLSIYVSKSYIQLRNRAGDYLKSSTLDMLLLRTCRIVLGALQYGT